jgi:hypothetical protein
VLSGVFSTYLSTRKGDDLANDMNIGAVICNAS